MKKLLIILIVLLAIGCGDGHEEEVPAETNSECPCDGRCDLCSSPGDYGD